jgi:carbamate kinase
MEPKTIVVAIGGNSLIEDPNHVTVAAQYHAARKTMKHIVALAAQGHRIIIGHGNGPQVGFVLRRSELSRNVLHTVPLDSCVADTQGAIGYNLQMAAVNEAETLGISVQAATVVTQVLVDRGDPSFADPSKPIGSFMDRQSAEFFRDSEGWRIVEDAGRGYRRVVPSPRPVSILELQTIRALSESGVLVIACGGGGIPVVREPDGELVGIEAVIDKDFAASLMARELKADLFIISTAVDKVCINYGKPDERKLDSITCAEAESYAAQGHFAPGSMLPKVKAIVEFVRETGNAGIITDPAHLTEALAGEAGTRIVRD